MTVAETGFAEISVGVETDFDLCERGEIDGVATSLGSKLK